MTQHIEFVDWRTTSSLELIRDGYKFRPKGRWQWLQRLAWGFLERAKVLEPAYEQKVTIERYSIDGKDFIAKLYKQRGSLFRFFNKEGQTLLIGAEDWAEITQSKSVPRDMFGFRSELHNGYGFMGLHVTVVPWMRGMVVMP